MFSQPAGKGRRRKFCEACSPKRERPGRQAPVLQLAARSASPAEPKPRKSLSQRTLDELTAAGRDDTWQAEAALLAADLVDAGGYTAQGAAALLKAHREALALALEGSEPTADVVDLIFGAEA
jgi:hypothetical protein